MRVSRPRRGAALVAALLIFVSILSSCAGVSVEGATAVKLVAPSDGLYEVSARELAAAGFDLGGATRDTLTLTVGGVPAAFQLIGEGRNPLMRFEGMG